MTGATPPPRFRDTALASGLLSPGQITASEEAVRERLGGSAHDDARRWDAEIADLLVHQGAITRFQADQLLAGRRKLTLGQYEVVDELGRGGMGQVFRARHALMGRMVAIKVLPRSKSTPEAEAAFQREIRMLARLDHDNLVRALDAGHDGKVYYLVTELVPGLDLRRQVLRHGPLDETAAASVICQAAKGLSYAHSQGLVHRDIKPSNLLVSPDGRVKVLDLGLAGSLFDEESTRLGRVVGTMDYMAPEQIREPDAVGPQADIYALGCTLYFTLTGELPFPGGTRREKAKRQVSEQPRPIRQLRPGVDQGLCKVVEAMMRKDPEERLQSAEAVIDRLRAWTPQQPVPMPRSGKRRAAAVDGTAGTARSSFLASGSSVDGGAADLSHASQQATRGGGSEADETGWSIGSAVGRGRAASRGTAGGLEGPTLATAHASIAGVLRAVRRSLIRGIHWLAVAVVMGILAAALARQVSLFGGRSVAPAFWGAFWLAFLWQAWRSFVAGAGRRRQESPSGPTGGLER